MSELWLMGCLMHVDFSGQARLGKADQFTRPRTSPSNFQLYHQLDNVSHSKIARLKKKRLRYKFQVLQLALIPTGHLCSWAGFQECLIPAPDPPPH
jgi:hypothetical protein